VSFAAITLCIASRQVFIVVVVYFVIDSVRKLLDTPSCMSLVCRYVRLCVITTNHSLLTVPNVNKIPYVDFSDRYA